MSGFDYDVFLEVVLFFFATWFVARLFRMAGLPGILGGLLMGVVLGPEVLDVVPYASDGACDSLQSLADGLKLAFKEDIMPALADKPVYFLAPVIATIPAFVAFSVNPRAW